MEGDRVIILPGASNSRNDWRAVKEGLARINISGILLERNIGAIPTFHRSNLEEKRNEYHEISRNELARIIDREKPGVLIAHSMGTVDALQIMNQGWEAMKALFLTPPQIGRAHV